MLYPNLQILTHIVEACHRLDEKGLVANHDGNISVKWENGVIATPTAFAKKDVQVEDLLFLDFDGNVVQGKHKVFSEIQWHLGIYKVRPDIKVVVHGHPPTAAGLGIAGIEIGQPAIPEAIVSLGPKIPLLELCFPTDEDFLPRLKSCLSENDTFVAQGNGAWAVGTEVIQTYLRLELVEHIAKQHFVGLQAGNIRELPADLVHSLVKKRPQPKAAQPTTYDLVRQIVQSELKSIIE